MSRNHIYVVAGILIIGGIFFVLYSGKMNTLMSATDDSPHRTDVIGTIVEIHDLAGSPAFIVETTMGRRQDVFWDSSSIGNLHVGDKVRISGLYYPYGGFIKPDNVTVISSVR